MNSKRLIAHYKSMAYWYRGLCKSTACWRAEKAAGVTYTDEERAELNRAAGMLRDAKTIMSGIYAKRIGDAIVAESLW